MLYPPISSVSIFLTSLSMWMESLGIRLLLKMSALFSLQSPPVSVYEPGAAFLFRFDFRREVSGMAGEGFSFSPAALEGDL